MTLRTFARPLLTALILSLAPMSRAQTLANGNFATGDLTGWTADMIDGGTATVEKQGGASFSGIAGSNQIPFPDGPGSYAVNIRSSGPAPLDSVGILTSDPFVPRSGTLTFFALSENASVAPMLLILKPSADPVNPDPADVLLMADVVNAHPSTGAAAAFEYQTVDISKLFAAKQPIRVQFRQHTAAAGAGYFTLIADVDDTGPKPDTVPPAAITNLSVSNPGPSSVTLSFTSPKDTGIGSAGNASSYDVRYSLSPITADNFAAAARFGGAPQPAAAGAKEKFDVTGLGPIQAYYFAARAIDAAKNAGAISNVVTATTTAFTAGGPGLTAQYFTWDSTIPTPPDRTMIFDSKKLVATRLEPNVDIDYTTQSPPGVPLTYFSVRYTGTVTPKFSEDYTFCTASDDGTRLWVSATPINPDSDTPLVDNWLQQAETELCADHAITMTAGKAYNLVMEYEQGVGGASARLRWSSKSQPKGIVPVSALTSSTTLVPDPRGRATGTVHDASGAPVAGVGVQLRTAMGAAGTTTTDASGVYTLLVPPGSYALTGGNLFGGIPASTPPVVVALGMLTAVPTVTLGTPSARGLGIYNGNFATGDFSGWSTGGTDGGFAAIEPQGTAFSGIAGSDMIPYPDGVNSFVANVRSSGPAPLDSIGILISDPFVPNAASLTFKTLSENASVTPQLLILKPSADPINPKPEDILLMADVLNDTPGTGDQAMFEDQKIDLSMFYNAKDPTKGTPIRVEVRQHTAAAGAGYFTLFTDFNAGAVAALPGGPPAGVPGDLNGDGKVDLKDATLSLQLAVNLLMPTAAQTTAGDVNKDGKLDLKDTTLILQAAVGLKSLM